MGIIVPGSTTPATGEETVAAIGLSGRSDGQTGAKADDRGVWRKRKKGIQRELPADERDDA